jgi:hypothetical protein
LPSDQKPDKLQLWLGEKLDKTMTDDLGTIMRETYDEWVLTFHSESVALSAWEALQDGS